MPRFSREDDVPIRAMLDALASAVEKDLSDDELAARAGVHRRDAVAALEHLRYLGLVSLAYELRTKRGSAEFRYALTPAGRAHVLAPHG